MKTKCLTLLLLLSAAVAYAETMRVAILEPVDRENKVSYATKLVLRSNLAKAVTNTEGYEAYDRSDMDAIMGEQNFQRTGMVSEDQIKRLGEMTGAKFILVAEAAVIDAQNMFITAKVLDVETARTMMTDNLMMGMDAENIQEGCATLADNLFRSTAAMPITKNKDKYEAPVVVNSAKSNAITLERLDKNLYTYGGTEMDSKAMEQFLRNNCPVAYRKYTSGKTLIKAGWGVFGGGLAMIVVGGVLMAIADSDAGFVLAFSGPFITCGAGIPLLCVGYHHTGHAHEIFNRQCATQEKLTLNLQSSQNGLGLALNF